MESRNRFHDLALSWADDIKAYRERMAKTPVVPFGKERVGLPELRERFQRAGPGEKREMIAQHGVAAIVRAMKGVQDAAAAE